MGPFVPPQGGGMQNPMNFFPNPMGGQNFPQQLNPQQLNPQQLNPQQLNQQQLNQQQQQQLMGGPGGMQQRQQPNNDPNNANDPRLLFNL